MKYSIYVMGIMVAFVSFIGFVVENLWLAFTKGYINNRNMNLPFLLGYGLAIIAIYLLFGTPNEMVFFTKYEFKAIPILKYFIYFLLVMICVSVGEIIIGTATEKLCNIEYWNYSDIPFHVTKYTSVPTSVGFATGITIFMNTVFIPFMDKINAMNPKLIKICAIVLTLLLVIDFVISYGKMIHTKKFYLKWKIGHFISFKNIKQHFSLWGVK